MLKSRETPRTPRPAAWDVVLACGRYTLETPSPLSDRDVMAAFASAFGTGDLASLPERGAEVVAAAWAHPDVLLPDEPGPALREAGWTDADVLAVALAIMREWNAAATMYAQALERASSFGPGRAGGAALSYSISAPSTAATPGPGTASPTPSGSS
jgi:hypothetical protein